MTILAAIRPMSSPGLGVECLVTLLRRIARSYGVSAFQLTRFLLESDEVNSVCGGVIPKYHFSSVWRINGYSPLTHAIAGRLCVCTGVESILGTTLLNLGPALSRNSVGSVAAAARYCPGCLPELKDEASGEIWLPLLWSLSSVSSCHIHKCALVKMDLGTDIDKIIAPDLGHENWSGGSESWSVAESLRLVEHCSRVGSLDQLENRFSEFLAMLWEGRPGLSPSEYARRLGVDRGALKSYLDGTKKPTLLTAFRIGAASSVSPLEVLVGGRDAGRGADLFEGEVLPVRPRIRRSLDFKKRVGDDLRRVLASEDALLPWTVYLKTLGTSDGYMRHWYWSDARKYANRRHREERARRSSLRTYARRACTSYAKDRSHRASRKQMIVELNIATGLPRALLREASHRGFMTSLHELGNSSVSGKSVKK